MLKTYIISQYIRHSFANELVTATQVSQVVISSVKERNPYCGCLYILLYHFPLF
jgi:hypothetical protein